MFSNLQLDIAPTLYWERIMYIFFRISFCPLIIYVLNFIVVQVQFSAFFPYNSPPTPAIPTSRP